MTNKTNHFGHPAGSDQQSLFGEGDDRLQMPVQSYAPDPERVRRKMMALLERARSAEAMPWSERETRMWQTVFPQMANWLPKDEAEQLCFEFAREIERLKLAA
ncbi:MAG: hypothetical protein JSS00_05400 [Proteobacteria bacterium]|nr:hypothetical protein [Pseudomonadota bacterium]